MTDLTDSSKPIPFIDLQTQARRLRSDIDEAIARVLDHGRFIMGPEVAELETALADFAGTAQAITCSSATDALLMALMAWDIGPGDAVFVPAFTFASSAEVVALAGATPVFVDVHEETFNIDPKSLQRAIEAISGVAPKAVMAVDMFGLPADYSAVKQIASETGLRVIADSAQSFGGALEGVRVGALGDIATTSFFPAKPLGCYGNGGAIFTDDPETAEVLRSIRVHGQGRDKYDNVRIGINGRLDTVQAAILLQKLTIFEEELDARQQVAERYGKLLQDTVKVPAMPEGSKSAWAQYTIRVRGREEVANSLREAGIPTAVYYPKCLHEQAAFDNYPADPAGLAMAESLAREVLSLPMHPYLQASDQERIASETKRAVARLKS